MRGNRCGELIMAVAVGWHAPCARVSEPVREYKEPVVHCPARLAMQRTLGDNGQWRRGRKGRAREDGVIRERKVSRKLIWVTTYGR
jgi:hypothetical protein